MHQQAPLLPSKTGIVIINMVRDCGRSPLAAAVVSSIIQGEGSGRWSFGGRPRFRSWVGEARRSQVGQVDWVMGLINSGESATGIENLCVRGRLLAAAAIVTPKGAHGYSWSNKKLSL
jgi:hypothetical protein